MSSDVVCMALASVPAGEQRSRFLAVGLADNTVRIISLDPSDCLTPLSMQALPDAAESLCIAEMGGTEERDGEPGIQGQLYLNIGELIQLLGLYMYLLSVMNFFLHATLMSFRINQLITS